MTDFEPLDALWDACEFEAVEREASAALRGAEAEDVPELWRYVAAARFELGRFRRALEAARSAKDPLLEAKAHFHLWELDAARAALARFEGDGEEAAEALWYEGVLAEFAGEDGVAHFREAARLAPDLYDEPVALSDQQADAVVRGALDALPDDVKEVVAEAAIEVLDLPPSHPDVDPLTLGLYRGTSLLERSVEDGARLPPRIEIYRKNLARFARDPREAVDELRITLLHEIAHHLGYDEEGVSALGLG